MIPVLTAAVVWRRLFPVVREIFKATRKKSPGGKGITPAEKRKIIRAGIGRMESILDDAL